MRLTLYLFVLAIPFEPLDVGFMTGFLSIAKITGALFFGACLLYRPLCFPRPARPVWWFAVYWLFSTLYVFVLPKFVIWSHIINVITVAQLILLLWVGSVLLREERILRTVLVCFLSSCAALSLGNLLNVPGFSEVIGSEHSGYRITALGYNLNELAFLLGFAVLMGVGLLLDRARWKRWRRALLLLTLAPTVVLMVRTGSRGGLLAFVAAVALYLGPIGRPGRRVVAILLGIAAIAGSVYLVIQDPKMLNRWSKSYKEGDTAGRDFIFANVWDMIQKKPIFGWGPVAYTYEIGLRTGHEQRDPHNLYLGLLAEVGIFGILPFLRGLWLSTHAAWRARTGVFGVLPFTLITMMLLSNLTGNGINRKVMWLVMAIAIGSAVAARISVIPRPLPREEASPPGLPA